MIDIKVLRAMADAGATVEMILVAVEASVESDRARREKERDRKRAWRGTNQMSQDKTGQDGTTPPPSFSPIPPITTPTPDLPNGKSIKPPSECPFFKEFWEVYPRKVGKGEALKAFRNALKRATGEEIVAGARRYAASKPDPEFTKHPGPWLNADRWLDETKTKEFVPSGPRRSWAEIKAERDGAT